MKANTISDETEALGHVIDDAVKEALLLCPTIKQKKRWVVKARQQQQQETGFINEI